LLYEYIVMTLGAFAKLRKATFSLVVSVCSSVRTEKLGSYWMDFRELLYSNIFLKSVGKIHVSVNSDENKGYFK
jgi:hypothetical protein